HRRSTLFPYTTLFRSAVGTVLISLNFYRITTKVPGSLLAIVLATLAVQFFELPVETIETKFGEIPNTLAMPEMPHIDFSVIQELIEPPITIVHLGYIESMFSAV